MRSTIGNKLASLYKFTKQNTMCWLLYKNLQTKHNTDEAIPFARSQKSHHKYIVSKRFSGSKTSPNN